MVVEQLNYEEYKGRKYRTEILSDRYLAIEQAGEGFGIIDTMDDETFNKWMDYHFTICERQDLIGASHHTLDILQKSDIQEKESLEHGLQSEDL